MKRMAIPARISQISEKDFWGSLKVPKGGRHAGLLKTAIKLGRNGHRADAYRALAEYHKVSLAGEWEVIRTAQRKSAPPSPQGLKDLLNHKIATWHTQVFQFGKVIDWAPDKLPSDCTHGFHYLGWLGPAITAAIQTGDERYRRFLIDILGQYYEGTRRHPKWESVLQHCIFGHLGIAAKWPTLLAAYLTLLQGGPLPAETIEGVLKTFLGFGRYLQHSMTAFQSGVNSFAVATISHFHIARALPEFKESAAWERKAVGFLVRHAREGFFDDGGNLERVWGYGTMHVSTLSRAVEIGRRTGGLGRNGKEIVARLRQACQWYLKTLGPPPAYAFPTYGDAGWSTHDRLPTIQAMARCLPEYKKDPFLGVDRTRGYLLKPSGFAILRNGDTPRSTFLNLNFGTFGGWHSHWDLLSLNLWAFGEPLLEELCRFGPYANPLDQLFRAPESHNLALIDGMVYDSRLVEGQDVQWFSNDTVEYFSAYHRAYRFFVFGRDASPVSPNIEAKIRRTVLLVKDPGYAVVLDAVENINSAKFNLAISQYWHAPTPFRVVGPGAVRTEGRTACWVVQGRTEGLHRQDTGKDFGGAEVAHLGVAYDRYNLRARRWMPINHTGISGFTTVLFPFQGKPPAVSVTPLPTRGGGLWRTEAVEISTPFGRDVVILNPEKVKGVSCGGGAVSGRAMVRLGRGRGQARVP
ncbi:MAG: heparinase II/III family protein [Lentisphaerae bacterium]|nr:heparinase II/III family protein [Lentisphaerota bacterium]